MPKAGFDLVREIGLALAGAEESTYYGQPALKVGGRMFACMASHRSAEPGSLVVAVDFARRNELLAGAPNVYYLTPHYMSYRLCSCDCLASRPTRSGGCSPALSSSRKRPNANARPTRPDGRRL